MDFHSDRVKYMYSGRNVHLQWVRAVREWLCVDGLQVVDLGCGGGLYDEAWIAAGARSVVGVDASAVMIEAAREAYGTRSDISFAVADARATGLEGNAYDVVFSRAVIHHMQLREVTELLREAYRLLRSGGSVLVQDRTVEDVLLPGAPDHIRGYFFEMYPRLRDVEVRRRHAVSEVSTAFAEAGLCRVSVERMWETRSEYSDFQGLERDLLARAGRSILHELSDAELRALVANIRKKLRCRPIVDRDRWTVWRAIKP
ncbi:class I SAM-dependent methyltransferase [Alicyclobacillus fastidiosus]|uniref:Methyltransferase domain-containing protein n=1 Tax=Alicyclobacillus fastidiosus TaxID=392011 RepID=A0ABV5AIF4_9BACL|nr:class I SAM-dependent methyltransferase [Alicyclobacillus fastidiosus]WEH11163.1 methyltransferase domain-containing protein [Alicyclobacillus fastidiosus]